MKTTVLILALLTLVSCGKNESGKSSHVMIQDPYVVGEDDATRRSFVLAGQSLLSRYDEKLKEMFGPRTVGLIRNRLKYENIQVSEVILYSDQNLITRSTNRNALITLYTGNERPDLNWVTYYSQPQKYERLVMHELLLLGEVNDRNFVFTNQIIRRR